MKVDTIKNIERVPLAIDYRRMYRGTVMLAIGPRMTSGSRIEFALEMSPFGSHEVSINFLETTEYPLVPAIKILKEFIKNMDRDGQLP